MVVDDVGGQKELERVSQVDQTTISAWLKQVKNPKFQTVKKIADSTGFSAEWLYLGRGSRRQEQGPQVSLEAGSLDLELLAEVIEHVESALTMRRQEYRLKPRDKAKVVALAYDFYRTTNTGEVRRAKILDFIRRGS